MSIKNISRYDYNSSCGWLARYHARDCVIACLFSDSRYAYDPARSQAAARRWLCGLAQTVTPRMRYRPGRGICLRLKRERGRQDVLVYDVSYQQDGVRKTRTFRVHHFATQQAALETVVVFREQMEQVMQAEHMAQLQRQWQEG